ncbi:MAG TPA: general secretion pathway protein GspB [Candidatus Saccharimonadia bacterium]|nr:general secretion pathway protein GspB [Candidatus Saccharimonadia bacterium]
MSLIYEALRKSEQQRRLGETPTLTTPPSWTPRRRRPYRAAVFAAIVVALAGGAWWLGRASLRDGADGRQAAVAPVPVSRVPTATAPPEPVSVPQPPASASAAPAAPAAVDAVPPPEPVAAAMPPPPADAAAPPAISPELQRKLDAGEIFANSPEQLATRAPTSEQAYVPPDAALPEPLPDLENAPVAAVPDPSLPPPPAPVPADPNAIATVVVPPRAPAPAPEPAASPPPVTTLAEDAAAGAAAAPVAPRDGATPVPYVFELPLATRRELPPLKLNMHVYSDDAAHRFVIVDGTRAAEGGNVSTDLDVVEIRNDGVVLAFRGTRFLLPRTGG